MESFMTKERCAGVKVKQSERQVSLSPCLRELSSQSLKPPRIFVAALLQISGLFTEKYQSNHESNDDYFLVGKT